MKTKQNLKTNKARLLCLALEIYYPASALVVCYLLTWEAHVFMAVTCTSHQLQSECILSADSWPTRT